MIELIITMANLSTAVISLITAIVISRSAKK